MVRPDHFKYICVNLYIVTKNYKRLQIYLLSNDDFRRCISDSLRQKWNDMANSVLNRWEGNSIRMSRDIIIDYCSFKIDRNFDDFFNESKLVAKLNEIQINKTNELLGLDLN